MKTLVLVSLFLFLGSVASAQADQPAGVCFAMDPNGPFENFCRTLTTQYDCLRFSNHCVWSPYHSQPTSIYEKEENGQESQKNREEAR